jgi:hypothetical protein
VAQVGLRPAAAEAANGARPLVQLEARLVSGQLEPPGRPAAQSTPQSAESAPLVVVTAPLAAVTALQSAEPAQLSSTPAPRTAVPATLPADSALRAAGSVLRSAESAPVLWVSCPESLPVERVLTPKLVTHTQHTGCVAGDPGQSWDVAWKSRVQ